jgi:hypothetical protein
VDFNDRVEKGQILATIEIARALVTAPVLLVADPIEALRHE